MSSKKVKLDQIYENPSAAFANFKKFKRYSQNPSSKEKPVPAQEEADSKTSPEQVPESVPALDPNLVHTSPKKFSDFIKKSHDKPSVTSGEPVSVSSFEPDCLVGLTFVFTGDLQRLSRESSVDFVKELVTGAVSSKTSFLVVGSDPGNTKVTKAKASKVTMLDESGFFQLLELKSKEKKKSSATTTKPKEDTQAVPQTIKKTPPKNLARTKKSDQSFQPVSDTIKVYDAFVDKYKPKSLSEVIGQKTNIDQLKTFLNNFDPKSDGKKAALLSGPPGIGKTTIAHLVSKDLGFDVIEMNASEVRNKSCMDNIVGEILGNRTIYEFFGKTKVKKHVLIMDEVDGMGAGDRGGLQTLVQLIKKSKVPLICICNDRQSPKIRTLANYCLDLRFSRPSAVQAKARLTEIAKNECITFDSNALEELLHSTQGDIRQMLNILQQVKLRNNCSLSFQDAKKVDKKNMDLNIFSICEKLFNLQSSIEDKFEYYFMDYQLAPLFVYENYPKMIPRGTNNDYIDHMFLAADALSCADIIERRIYQYQDYSILPTHAAQSCIIPVSLMNGTLKGRIDFPSILGNISKANKFLRLLKEICLHLSLHTSGDKVSIRLSYMSSIVQKLLFLLKGGNIDGAIECLNYYCLTKEDWDTILEFFVGEDVSKQLTTQTKTNFTRAYNKSSHILPFAVADLKKLKAQKEVQVGIDAEELVMDDLKDDEDKGEEEEPEDKMIIEKVKKDTKVAKKDKKPTKSTN